MTDLRQAAQQALEALIDAANVLSAPMFSDAAAALRTALEQQAEPVAYYHPRNGFYWAKPTSIFAPTVVDVPPMPLYAEPPQRKWQGLTDEDWEKVANRKNTVLDTFEQGATWAAYKLERRNT